jgi:hypothetical protein
MKRLTITLLLLAFGIAACSEDSSAPTPPKTDTGVDVVVEDTTPDTTPPDPEIVVPPDQEVLPPPDVEPDADVIEDAREDVERPPCDTDNDCQRPDPCVVGRCTPSGCVFAPKDCRPAGADDCDDWICHPVTGACELHRNARCACLCLTNPAICDDGNPCTTHTCDEVDCCQYALAERECSDNNPCTVGDRCVADPIGGAVGVCEGGSPRNCDDGDPCTVN